MRLRPCLNFNFTVLELDAKELREYYYLFWSTET